jgi:hypothetical protein
LYQSQSLLKSNDDNDTVLAVIFIALVQIDASDPKTGYGFEVGLGAELGKGVDGEGIVAEDTGLVDLGEDEDLLDPWAIAVAMWRF